MSTKSDTSKKNPTKRIEYRGKNIRVSRTGGAAATTTVKGDAYAATLNTKRGIRLHKRLFKGARMGIQNGNLQLIGRYRGGPFNFNISKGGVSTSLKNKRGSYNLFKPNYSSFKMGGVQVRGKNAAILQLMYMFFILLINSVKLGWYVAVTLCWYLFLVLQWMFSFAVGFYKGFRT